MIVPMLLILGVFYLFLFRPQAKRQREHQSMLDVLKKGDRIVTNGGIVGTVWSLDDRLMTLEIADKVKVKVLRSQIAGRFDVDGGTSGQKG